MELISELKKPLLLYPSLHSFLRVDTVVVIYMLTDL